MGDVDVDAVAARLHVDLDAGRQRARGPAQRRQRARQRLAEQRTGRDVDDVVRPPRPKPERPARADRQLGALPIAERRARRDDVRHRDADGALDDRPLGRVLRRQRHVLPLAAAAGAEQRTGRRHPIRARPLDRGQLAPRDLPLLPLDARPHALAGRGERHEGGAPVVRRARALPALLPADGVAAERQRFDLDADLVVEHDGAIYGNVCPDRPRLRSKSKKPSSVPPMLGGGGSLRL